MGAGGPLVTDEGHHILDLHLQRIGDPAALATALNAIPGVVEHGLFIGMAEAVIVGRDDGGAELILRPGAEPEPVDVEEAMRNQDA
jgi:ribose 5-phosphate isomerase A